MTMAQASTEPRADAFGGSFFSRLPDRIAVPEDFQGDERLMIESAEQFSRKEVVPLVERLDAQEDGLMPRLLRKAADLGFCGVDAPETYGGLGQSKNLAARILEYLSLNASFSVTIGVHSGISQAGLALFGTADQKERYLPGLVTAETIGAYALSEPNAGSDALSATTRADRVAGGYRLSGTKMWISNAKWADVFTVFAKIDGRDFTGFIVERAFPGVQVEREEHKLGLKGSSTARLVLDDVFVPDGNVLYEPGLGHHVAFNALNLGRFKLSAMSLGPARDMIGQASRYAQERRQFGAPIASFGLVRQKFADMATRFFAAESMIYRTGALIDAAFAVHGGDVAGNRRACEEYSIECSACKVMATEVEGFVLDEAVQVYGGYGFSEEFPAARHYRDARISRIYEGTNEINRLFLADRLRRRDREGRASLVAIGDSFASELAGRAMREDVEDQVRMGALSDLVMLVYAEQSARLRAVQTGSQVHEALSHAVTRWVNPLAANAFQVVTGEAVGLPAPPPLTVEELSEAVYGAGAPL